jgi:SEC-C motif-containing protein
MPGLPAICDTCSTVWDPHALNISNATDIHIADVTVGPCPNCGGTGHIPDGIYSATTDTIKVIATSARSVQSLERLRRILEHARSQRASAAELAQTLEETDDLKPVAAIIRRLPKKLDIKYWIGIALAVVTIMQAQATDHKIDNMQAEMDRIYAQVMSPHPAPVPVQTPITAPSPSPYGKVGRNDPCPCCSGKKFKRCHGVQ